MTFETLNYTKNMHKNKRKNSTKLMGARCVGHGGHVPPRFC